MPIKVKQEEQSVVLSVAGEPPEEAIRRHRESTKVPELVATG